ncbi:MAG: hypothetical protein WD734_04980 [Dehalococcoidia bacterium]
MTDVLALTARVLGAVAFAVVAVLLLFWAIDMFSHEFEGRSEMSGFFLVLGTAGALSALLFAAAAAATLVDAGRRTWTVILVGALLASLLPYPVVFGMETLAAYLPLLAVAAVALWRRSIP